MTTEMALCRDFIEAHAEDAAQVIERLSAAEAAALLVALPAPTAARALDAMMPADAARALALVDPDATAAMLVELRAGRAAAVLRPFDAAAADAVLARMPSADARALRHMLAHPPGSAGAVMDARVVTARDGDRVGEVRAAWRRTPRPVHDYVFVVDEEHRLTGVVALRDLAAARPGDPLAAVTNRSVGRVHASANRAAVVNHPGWRHCHALPVVDEQGVLIGAITHETMRALSDEDALGGTRRFDAASTVFALGELYWLGLSGMLDGVAAAVRRPAESAREVPHGRR